MTLKIYNSKFKNTNYESGVTLVLVLAILSILTLLGLSFTFVMRTEMQAADNFASKFELFSDKCAKRYNIPYEQLKAIKDLREIIIAHKKSPVEFSRKANFVICEDNYRTRTISSNEVKNYIEKAKLFIKDVTTIISKGEAIFS